MTLHSTLSLPGHRPADGSARPLLIAEGLHILDNRVHRAITDGDARTIINLASRQLASGADALALNMGPGREMAGRAQWVLDILLDHFTAPLFVSAGIQDLLSSLQTEPGRITVNAVTAENKSLAAALRMSVRCGTDLVVLLVRPGLTPAGLDDRLQIAAEVIELARETGLPLCRLYLDPVLGCRPDPLAWQISRGMPDIGTVAESVSLIKQLAGEVNTLTSLGTGTAGISGTRRSDAQRAMLSLLSAAGLDAVIINSLDRKLMETATGEQAEAF